jgi:hypothetical protein
MAAITNVTLNLQRSGSLAPSSPRTASVTFTTKFSLFEVQGNALFNADVRLYPVDGMTLGISLNIGSASVRATDITVQTTLSITLKRSDLDEDQDRETWYDEHGHPFYISEELVDEWRARVVLTPVIQTITRYSSIVQGSWGYEGNN